MKKMFTLGMLSVLVVMTSCRREESQNISQDRIYSEYEVIFDAGKNQTVANATFRADHSTGTKIELSFPARIKFRNENMSWKNVTGNYQLTVNGNGFSNYFTYTDLDENNFENQSFDVSYIDLPNGLNSISKNGNFFLPWNGDPLRSGETVRVVIKSKEGGGERSWSVTSVNSTHIVLDQYKLSQINEGLAEIWIERTKSDGLIMVPDAGGRMSCTWRSNELTIQILN